MILFSKLCDSLDYDYILVEDTAICGLAIAEKAKKTDIAVCFTQSQALNTEAFAIICKQPLGSYGKSKVLHNDIDNTVIDFCNAFIELGIYRDYIKVNKYNTVNGYMLGEDVSIGSNTQIEPYVVIGDRTVIGNNCRIGAGVYIGADTIIGDNVIIGANSVIAGAPHYAANTSMNGYRSFAGIGQVMICDDVTIGAGTVIERGMLDTTIINEGSFIGDLVNIGHDVQVGTSTRILSQCGIAGYSTVGNNSIIYGQCGVAGNIIIGNSVIVKAKTSVTRNITDNSVISGRYGRDDRDELALQAALRRKFKKGMWL